MLAAIRFVVVFISFFRHPYHTVSLLTLLHLSRFTWELDCPRHSELIKRIGDSGIQFWNWVFHSHLKKSLGSPAGAEDVVTFSPD